MLKKNCEKGYVKAIKKRRRKLPTLKGKSKIKGRRMPIKFRKDKRSFTTNVKNRYQKKREATNMTFGIHDKTPEVIR